MRLKYIILLLLIVCSSVQAKDSFPAGDGLSDYTQFRLFPHVDKAYRLTEQSRYAEAVPIWKDALNISPYNRVVTKELIATYLKLKEFQNADRLIEHYLSLNSTDNEFYALQIEVLIEAIEQGDNEALERAKEKLKDDRIDKQLRFHLLYEASHYSYEHGQKDDALNLIKTHLFLDNADFVVHLADANILLKEQRLEDVEQLLKDNQFSHSHAGKQIRQALLQAYVGRGKDTQALQQFSILNEEHSLTKDEIDQWVVLLIKRNEISKADKLLALQTDNFDAQFKRVYINLKAGRDQQTRAPLNNAIKLIKTAEQERQVLILAAELVSKQKQLSLYYYEHEVKFSENTSLWRDTAVNIAEQNDDYRQAIQLLAAKKNLTKKDRQTIAELYQKQGNSDKYQLIYQQLNQDYPTDWKILANYSYQLIESDQQNVAYEHLIKSYPFKGATTVEAETLKSYMFELASGIDNSELERQLLMLPNTSFNDSERQQLAVLWMQVGYCDRARKLYSKPYRRKNMLNLGYCFKQNGSVYAYDYFIQADQLRSGSDTQIELAYIEAESGQQQKAFDRWLTLTTGTLENRHYLQAAQTALSVEEITQAKLWFNQYEKNKGEKKLAYWNFKAQLSKKTGDNTGALISLQQAQKIDPTAQRLIQIAALQSPEQAVVTRQQAELLLRSALLVDPDNSRLSQELGYLLLSEDKSQEAILHFENSLKGMPDNYPMYQQLSYLYLQNDNKEMAQVWSGKATENMNYYITEPVNGVSVEQLKFNKRRYNEQLEREYNLNFDLWYGKNSVPAYLPVAADDKENNYANYWQLLLESKPDKFKTALGDVAVYGRLFGQNSSTQRIGSPSGVDMLGLGARLAPFANQSFYLYAEPQYHLDLNQADLMVRATASFFSTGEYSSEWHNDGNGWTEQELYFDAAYWSKDGVHAVTSKYSIGHNFKLSSSFDQAWTIKPYGLLQVSGNDLGGVSSVGAGLEFNLWSNGSETVAYSRKSTVKLEFTRAFETYLDDDHGIGLTVRLAW
ncbi:NfrA family protein [Moritella yayanosii]|uniref:Bacteriophage N4 adsorption protein A C-terminal domain-containing protein n=1 Tax=Moritella yayanosii TaxID=69539 RepID=A0A330LVI8_9GAMM|nr:hypothetical protein [Moritella yayanosii]SQD80693.1 conserved exported protein of unknown function [Moritella yayanosii]